MAPGATTMVQGDIQCRMSSRRLLFAGALVATAAAARPPLTALGALAGEIQAALQLSSLTIGALTTLPLLIFMALSAVAVRIGDEVGQERAVLAGLLAVLGGSVLRVVPGTPSLFLGTAAIAVGITGLNVLLPALVRAWFPQNLGRMTSAYTTAMAISGGVASWAVVRWEHEAIGAWRGALAATALFPTVAVVLWWFARDPGKPRATAAFAAKVRSKMPWSSAMAWSVAMAFAAQSMIFYSLVAWLAPLMVSKGLSTADAGAVLGIFSASGVVTSMLVPIAAARRKGQVGLAALLGALQMIGALGLWYGNTLGAACAAMLLGLGTAGQFSLAFTLFGLRGGSAAATAALSGMAQSIGYGLGAVGPSVFGWLHDAQGDWSGLQVGLLALAVLSTAAACRASRPGITVSTT